MKARFACLLDLLELIVLKLRNSAVVHHNCKRKG